MGFWERRRHIKEAKGMLRVGAQVENLHEALLVVSKQADQWHMFVPHGGWPVLPAKLDDIIETQENLNRDMTALNAVLATTPQGGNLETVDFNQVEERLKALYDDKQALDNLPERARLERDFHSVGLDELVEDLNNRGIPNDAVAGELQLAWWTTCVRSGRWWRRNPCVAYATCCSRVRRKPICCIPCLPAPVMFR